MNKVKKKAIVLLPLGPHGWASYSDIVPELKKIWTELDFEILPLDLPQPKLDEDLLEKIRSAKVLVFPLGHMHYDGLQFLAVLRTRYRILTPACIMHTSNITVGIRYLKRFETVLQGNDTLIVNCSAEKRLLKAFLPKIQLKIEVIPLPVNEEIFNRTGKIPKLAILRRQLVLPEEKEILLYAGRISTQKNILAALLVFRELLEKRNNLYFVILGSADNLGVPHLPARTRRNIIDLSEAISILGLEQKVEFRPAVVQPELAKYFHACDVNISLTLHSGEDFGYSIAQGLACGIPTVVSCWGGGLDLAKACYGVDVKISKAGPRIDLRMAKEKVLSALKAKRKAPPKHFKQSEIVHLWDRAISRYRAERPTPIERKKSMLGPSEIPLRNFFSSTSDPRFKKF